MFELVFFLVVFVAMAVFDIYKMKKAALKREFIPYAPLMIPSAVIALVYFLNPRGPSLLKIMMDLFGIKE